MRFLYAKICIHKIKVLPLHRQTKTITQKHKKNENKLHNLRD